MAVAEYYGGTFLKKFLAYIVSNDSKLVDEPWPKARTCKSACLVAKKMQIAKSQNETRSVIGPDMTFPMCLSERKPLSYTSQATYI